MHGPIQPPPAEALAAVLDICRDAVAIVLVNSDGLDLAWCNDAFRRLAATACSATAPPRAAQATARLLAERLRSAGGGSFAGRTQVELPGGWLVEVTGKPVTGPPATGLPATATPSNRRRPLAGTEQTAALIVWPIDDPTRPAEPATTDRVTGLPDRACLDRELTRRLAVGGEPFALLFVDVDGFKQINDQIGHLAGDATLREIARRLRAATRDCDLVARFGGDEFVVLAGGVTNRHTAGPILDRLSRSVNKPIAVNPRLEVSLSIGVAWSTDHETPEEILHAADRAMYAEKRGGERPRTR